MNTGISHRVSIGLLALLGIVGLSQRVFAVTKQELDAEKIGAAAGTKATTTSDGVVRTHGVAVGGTMGLTTWAAFSGSNELAAVDGDFIMAADEVQPVLKALRQGNLKIVALHNHMIGEHPSFYFVHFWGKGSTQELAKALKHALDAQHQVKPVARAKRLLGMIVALHRP